MMSRCDLVISRDHSQCEEAIEQVEGQAKEVKARLQVEEGLLDKSVSGTIRIFLTLAASCSLLILLLTLRNIFPSGHGCF